MNSERHCTKNPLSLRSQPMSLTLHPPESQHSGAVSGFPVVEALPLCRSLLALLHHVCPLGTDDADLSEIYFFSFGAESL